MECGGAEPCVECPETKLDAWLETVRGRQLALVIDLDRFKETARLVFAPGDLTYLETLLLGILWEERELYQQELMEQAAKEKGGHGR